jgi:branched-chain amino acid transport system substrate-binding protein
MKKITIIAVVIISLFIFMQNTKNKPENIKLGFVAGLSGKYSTLGVNVKDGVLMALEEINYKIGDNQIELIIKDDKQNPKDAKKAIDELVRQNESDNLIVSINFLLSSFTIAFSKFFSKSSE